MQTPEHNKPEIDAWLCGQPLEPSERFVENTLQQLHAVHDGKDNCAATLDALLAQQPIEPSPHFASNVLANINHEHPQDDPKVMGFPSWVFTLSTMAASLAVMMFAFTWMFNRGIEDARTPTHSVASTEMGMIADPVADGGIQAIEELLIMDEALQELSSLSEDTDVWETLALLVED